MQTGIYIYSTTASGGGLEVAPNHETGTADIVAGSYTAGDQFVVDDKVYTVAGTADATPGGTVDGIFAYAPDGKTVFISTAPITTSETLYLNPTTSQSDYICYMAGTQIATPGGSANVEELAIGDLVLTADGKTMPVLWVGRQTVSTTFADPNRVMPIRIRAGALGDAQPQRDLLVSPGHAILVDGILVHASALINGSSIMRETDVPNTFIYYHVELEDHSLVLAEGVPAETFVDNVQRLAFDNWDEHVKLFPEGRSIRELPLARAASARQVPASIVRKLASRSQELGISSREVA